MTYYIYTEVDSNDGDYVGTLTKIIPRNIPTIEKWILGLELSDAEAEKCAQYLPFIDNFAYSRVDVIRMNRVKQIKILTEIGIVDLLEGLTNGD